MKGFLLLTRAATPNALVTRIEQAETTELFKALYAHRKASLTQNCDKLLSNLFDLFQHDNKNVPLFANNTGLTVHHASLLGLFNVVSSALITVTQAAQVHNAWFVRETEQTHEEFEEEDDFEEEEDEEEEDSNDEVIDALLEAMAEQLEPGELVAVINAVTPSLATASHQVSQLLNALDLIVHEQGPDALLAVVQSVKPDFDFDPAPEDLADEAEPASVGVRFVASMEEALATLSAHQLKKLAEVLHVNTSNLEDGELLKRLVNIDEDTIISEIEELGFDFPEIEEEDEDFEEDEDEEEDGEYQEALTAVADQLLLFCEARLPELCDELGIGRQGSSHGMTHRIVGTQSRRSIIDALDRLDLEPPLELIMALDEKADQEHALGMHRKERTEHSAVVHEELDPMEAAFDENATFASNYELITSLSTLQLALAEHLTDREPGAMLITVIH